jgi:cytochrome oxidase assembly protein ShyY1
MHYGTHLDYAMTWGALHLVGSMLTMYVADAITIQEFRRHLI